MIEFYPQIKLLHIAMVVCSGSLFLLRGLLVQVGRQGVAMAAPVRWLSYAIDTTLLTAALMLLTILPHGMFANGWLTMKLVLVVVYVVLGTIALKRGRTPRARATSRHCWCSPSSSPSRGRTSRWESSSSCCTEANAAGLIPVKACARARPNLRA